MACMCLEGAHLPPPSPPRPGARSQLRSLTLVLPLLQSPFGFLLGAMVGVMVKLGSIHGHYHGVMLPLILLEMEVLGLLALPRRIRLAMLSVVNLERLFAARTLICRRPSLLCSVHSTLRVFAAFVPV